MLKKTINNISSVWQKFISILPEFPQKNKVCVIQIKKNKACVIEKDNYTIVLGDDIEIIDKNKKINITKNFDITVNGDVVLDANSLTIKTLDGKNLICNSLSHCLFSGTKHGWVESITGENRE